MSNKTNRNKVEKTCFCLRFRARYLYNTKIYFIWTTLMELLIVSKFSFYRLASISTIIHPYSIFYRLTHTTKYSKIHARILLCVSPYDLIVVVICLLHEYKVYIYICMWYLFSSSVLALPLPETHRIKIFSLAILQNEAHKYECFV